jgi:hypothetical protein
MYSTANFLEEEKMKYANHINGLVVKCYLLDFDEILQPELLVMDQVYKMEYRAYKVEKREMWLKVFPNEILELHRSGFVNGDIKMP